MESGHRIFVLAILGIAAAQASVGISILERKLAGATDNEDAKLNIRQLIEKYGYNGETHRVITDDGYLLQMHRITGSTVNPSAEGKSPVLLVHPLLGSSTDWILSGPEKAFAYILADQGYDVWLGNLRGNRFSKRHLNYTSVDKEFWQFSWHESGIHDLPAMIDYILEKSGKEQLTYVAHSQGSTAFWVMAAELPEYQDKVKAMFAFAPVAYMTHTRSPFYQVIGKWGFGIEKLLDFLGVYEFQPTSKFVQEIAATICKEESWGHFACSNVMFLMGGSSDQINSESLPTILAHTPAGGSVKQVLHFLQVLKAQKFQQYDYGIVKNLFKYGRIRPPTYKLTTINVPVYLYYSEGDRFATVEDVDRLYNELGNPIDKFKVPNDGFAHLDFMWGKDARELVYDKVVPLIGKYNN